MRTARLLSGLALLLSIAGTAAAQPLGEIAKKEEERRKAVKTPSKVWTADDLRRFGGVPQGPTVSQLGRAEAPPETPPETPPEAQAAEKAAGAAEPAAKPAEPEAEKDEAYWRQRVADLRERVNRGRFTYQVLEARAMALGAEYLATEDVNARAAVGRERERTLAEMEKIEREIDAATRGLADLEEEARRANVPPGWIR